MTESVIFIIFIL